MNEHKSEKFSIKVVFGEGFAFSRKLPYRFTDFRSAMLACAQIDSVIGNSNTDQEYMHSVINEGEDNEQTV